MKNTVFAAVLALLAFTLNAQNAIPKSRNYQYARDTNKLYYYYYYDTLQEKHRITDAIFDDAFSFSENMAVVKLKGKYGYIDTLGNLAIPAIYDNAAAFSEGAAIVLTDCKSGIIDKQNNLHLLAKEYGYIQSFVEGRCIVEYKDKYGAINRKGQEVIPTVYNYIYPFKNSRAIFSDTISGKDGVMDTNGVIIVTPKYDNIEGFNDIGLSNIKLNTVTYSRKKEVGEILTGIIDKDGNVIIPPVYNTIRANYPIDPKTHKMDSNKPFGFEAIISYKVKIKKRWKPNLRFWTKRFWRKSYRYTGDRYKTVTLYTHLYDNKGRYINSYHRQSLMRINATNYYVQSNDTLTIIPLEGKPHQIYNVDYTYTVDRDKDVRDLLIVKNKSGKYALYNTNGENVLGKEYDKIYGSQTLGYNFTNSYNIFAKNQDTIEIYSPQLTLVKKLLGDYLISKNYFKYDDDKARNYVYSYKYKDKTGILDSAFNIILPANYDLIKPDYNRIIVKQNNLYGLLNNQFKEIIPTQYTRITDGPSINNNTFYYIKTGVKKKAKEGVINEDGKIVVPAEYNDVRVIHYKKNEPNNSTRKIQYLENYYFSVFKNKKWGAIDSLGKVFVDIAYDWVSVNNQYVSVNKDKKTSLLTHDGKTVIPFQYKSIILYSSYKPSFQNGLFEVVGKNKKRGVVDSTGKVLIPVIYDEIGFGYTGYFDVKKGKKSGVLSPTGQVVYTTEYQQITRNADNYILNKKDKFGLGDNTGKIIIPLEYYSIAPWQLSLYKLTTLTKKKENIGIANKHGKIIIPVAYKSYQISCVRETIVLKADGKRYLYNAQGEPVNDCYIDTKIGSKSNSRSIDY